MRGIPGTACTVAFTLILTLGFAGSSQAATSVGLGAADSFAVLGGSGVTNTGPTMINGDLGTSPNPSVTGFGGAPNGTVNGSVHQADALAAQAQADLTTAYNNAAGQGPVNTVATELGGQSLTPGVYESTSGTFGITGTLTLNAQGNPDAVFIFDAASTLISASASRVRLINGAQPCQIFWKVGSSATLGTNSSFAGNILALQSISLNDGVDVAGRLLARNGAVTLINDTVTRVPCQTVGDGDGDGDGNDGAGDGTGGGGGSGGGGSGGGGGNNGGPGGPSVQITDIPGTGGGDNVRPRCIDRGFRAEIRVRGKVRIRSVKVFLGGQLIKRSTNRRFSVWIKARGLRSGRNTIRVVAVDENGRRNEKSKSFRRCAPAVPEPDFTG